MSILETRKLFGFPKLSFVDFKNAAYHVYKGAYRYALNIFFGQFFEGVFQQEVNLAVSEQMLLRIPLVETSKFFERIVIKTAYLLLPDKAIPACFDTDIYITREKDFLLKKPEVFSEEVKESIDLRAKNYQDLLEKHPDINLYIFNIETLEHSNYNPLSDLFPQADSGQSLQYFLERKPVKLNFVNFAPTSFEDYKEDFFRTDQHWKIGAAMQAYQQIYEMLRVNYPDISPMINVKSYEKIEGLEFLGSRARETLYPIEPDILEYVDVDLPSYTTYVNGVLMDYGKRDDYLSGIYHHEKYYNHYGGFYGDVQYSVYYHFENDSDRNLMMIVSSHSRMIQMYLASHYRDSYVIDMRFEENNLKPLEEYINEYQISDVLILGQPLITYYSTDYTILP